MVAPLAIIVAPIPEHTDADDGLSVTVGVGVTVITDESVLLQPPFVPVTVYVVLLAGVAITEAPVLLFNPVAGLHV